MSIKRLTSKSGMTLVELLVACAIAGFVVLGVGAALVHTQHNWESTYEQVNGDTTSDAYAAKRAFESVIRQSSVSIRPPALSEDGSFIELYLYKDIRSNSIDSYARFYLENNELVVVYGQLSNASYKEVVAADIGSIATTYDTESAFLSASTALTGTALELTDINQSISSEEAVKQLNEAAFAELFSQAVVRTDSTDSTVNMISYGGELRKLTLARNVKDVKFSVHGATVRMIMAIENEGERKNIICSAVRHSG